QPPAALCPGEPGERDPDWRVDAMVEALDAELGRFLAELRATSPDALVFVIGDNGSDPTARASTLDASRGKSTMFEGGLHVPLVVAGPGVVAGECAALVSSTDLYATLLQLAAEPSAAE